MTREEAMDIFEHNWTRLVNADYTEEELNKAIEMAIKALEQEPKTGHWTERKIHETTGFFLPTCSECGRIQPYAHHTFSWNYCPNCGAKMESEVNNDKT